MVIFELGEQTAHEVIELRRDPFFFTAVDVRADRLILRSVPKQHVEKLIDCEDQPKPSGVLLHVGIEFGIQLDELFRRALHEKNFPRSVTNCKAKEGNSSAVIGSFVPFAK